MQLKVEPVVLNGLVRKENGARGSYRERRKGVIPRIETTRIPGSFSMNQISADHRDRLALVAHSRSDISILGITPFLLEKKNAFTASLAKFNDSRPL